MGWSSSVYRILIIPPRSQNQSERRHGLTRVPGHPFPVHFFSIPYSYLQREGLGLLEYQAIPSLRGSLLRMVVYISYITAAGNSISSQVGSFCQGNRCGTEKAGGIRPVHHVQNHTFVSVVSVLYRNRQFRCFD
jgi:hypothetical protein